MISLCHLLLSNVNEGGTNKSLEIQIWWFYFTYLAYFFDKMLYSVYIHSTNNIPIFALLCHPSNGFVNITLAYIIAIKSSILTPTIF